MKRISKTTAFLFLTLSPLFLRAQIINSFPHTEDFESFTLCGTTCGDPCTLPGGWLNITNDGMDWTVFEGPTATANTGPDIDHNPGNATGNYLYTETSGCTNRTTAFTTPPIDLSGLSNFSFDFWYHMYGTAVPSLHIDVSTNNGMSYTDDVSPAVSLNMNLWQKKTVNLDAYAGDTIVIRLRGVTGNGASDMAVDDFTFYSLYNNDAGITDVTAPVNPYLPGPQDVTVTLANFGLNTLTGADINWMVNGIPQQVYNWTGSLTLNQTASVTIGNYNFPTGMSTIEVWTSNVNGAADPVSSNDTTVKTLCTGLNGAYTVGGGTPDFATLADAISALYSCGVSGPVVFNISAGSGPHIGQLNLTAVTGASAVNTIIFNGNGETIAAKPTTDDRHVIKLNGAKHFVFDNLKITGTDSTFGWGVFLTNRADSNTITNCTIDVSAVQSTATNNSAGIVATGSTTSVTITGNNASRLIAQYNTIIGGYQGIRMTGAQLTKSANHIIQNNTIRDFHSYGIYIADCDNAIISSNDISRGNRVTVGTFYGVYFDVRNQRILLEKNKIHNTHGSASSITGTANGIYSTGCDAPIGFENKVINNLIYDFVSNGTIYGIFNSSSDGTHYYHNTISLDDPTSSGGTTRGFYQTSTATNIQFRNNIVSVMRAGTGTKHCLYFGTTGSSIISNNNVLYTDTSQSTNHTGYFASDFHTMGLWQTANAGAYDNASIFTDPMFVGINNNLHPTNGALNGIGDSLGVTTDIDGNVRDASNPDPGAYEFSPLTADVAISWVSPLSPTTPGNKIIIVRVTNSVSSLQDITDLSVSYTDGGSPVTENISQLSIVPGASHDVVFSTQYNLTQYTTITAYINSANGIPDAFQSNDTTQQVLCPSLTGTYTINKALPTSATNFTSFTEAVNALTFCGIIAPVTFDVAPGSGPYTEQISIPLISGSSSINTITFNGNGNELQFAPVTGNRHIVKLTGAKYLIFNDLTIRGTGTAYGWGVHLINAADHNSFNGCTIDVSAVTSNTTADFACIVATNSTTSISSNANNANYLTVANCTLTGGGYGIRLNGNVSAKARGNNISGNTIRDFHSYGVYITHADSCEVTENDISRANKTNVGTFYGIYITTGVENTFITRNRIHNTHDNAANPSEPAYPIYFSSADAQLGKANYVVNNLIYNINGNGAIYGIYNGSSDHAKYYHNSIALDDSVALTTDETRGFYQTTTATGVEFRNNIITVKRGGTGSKHCIYLASTTSPVISNNNVLLMDAAGGVSNYLGRYGATDYATLGLWQTANSGSFDQNSLDVDPQFTDAGNGDLTPLNYAINNLGAAVGITTDFNLSPRNTNFPDPGAIEFTPLGLDAAITWVAPVAPISPGSHTITVNISNTQTIPITSLVLSYTDGTNVITENFTGLSIAGSASQDISFSTPFILTGFVNLYAYIDSVNLDIDETQLNDTTAIQVLCATMAGNYTIDKNIAASATNFTSFAAAVTRLTNCGISGPVVIEITAGSGPYNEQIIIPHVFGSSATNTITLDGNNETLTLAPTVDDRYLIRLNGTKHLTIKDLRITGTGTTYGYGIHFINEADSNTVNGCRIDLSAVTSTATDNSAGILFSGSVTSTGTDGNNGNYNTVIGNEVIGGYYGVRVNGLPSDPLIENNFINNIVRDFYAYGFLLANCEHTTIQGNDISRANRVNVSTFYGVNLSSGNQNILIERNRIHNTHDNASSLTGAAYPVYFASCDATAGNENIVVNNLIYNINSNGTIYAFYNSSSDGAYYYHNSISLDNQNTSGGTTRGFYQTSIATNISFINNVVSITRSGTGSKHCIYLGTNTSSVTSDYNLFYTDTTINYIGFFNTAFSGLAAWKTADSSSFDQHSTFADPVYGSIATGNLTPLNTTINDRGFPIGVTHDFNQNPRSLTAPDVGAYEFTPVLTDATVVAVLEPAENACGSAAVDVSAVITNFGINPLSGVFVTAVISGDLTGIFTGTSGSIANTESDTVSLGNFSLPAGGNITLTVYTSVPNDEVPFNDTLVVTRNINPPTASPVLLSFQDTVCVGGFTGLAVTPAPNISYYWYDTISGGIPVETGPLFITPNLTQDITYYVEASTDQTHSVGPADNLIGNSANFTSVGTRGLLFDVLTTITIDSLSVYPQDTGTVYVELTDVSNNTIYNIASTHISSGGIKVTIPVGFTVTPGSYRLDANGSTTGGLFYNSSGASYPYKIDGVVSITGNTFDPDHYYFFYDWKITEKGCPSDRIAIPIKVNQTDTAASAEFSFVPSGLDVTFTPDVNNPNNTYEWDFGDGATSNIASVAHQYLNDGTYNACLTAGNSCSQVTECHQVTVCGNLSAAFSYVTNGLAAAFSYTGAGLITNYDWNFGDGATSSAATPSHTFATEGTYDVTLIAENGCSDLDTITQTVTVCQATSADFTLQQVSPGGFEFNFTNTSGGIPVSFAWNFGDNTTSAAENPSHTYTAHDIYTVTLITTNACGASDTIAKNLNTCLATDVNFTATVQNDGKTVSITNTSAGTNLAYNWSFGDGTTSNVAEPTHTYLATGTYTITLTVTNACGQTDAQTQSVSVVVGILQVHANFSVHVFPNPNEGKFNISYELDKKSEVTIRLINFSGETVHRQNTDLPQGAHMQEIECTGLAKGLYFLEIKTENRTGAVKIVVE